MSIVGSNMPIFLGYMAPNGFLDEHPESHALWNYYLCARGAYERTIKDVIVLEGDPDPAANFKQLFVNMAQLYGVQPEAMAKCWRQVDMQCDLINMPRLPDEDRYRFNSVDEIFTKRSN